MFFKYERYPKHTKKIIKHHQVTSTPKALRKLTWNHLTVFWLNFEKSRRFLFCTFQVLVIIRCSRVEVSKTKIIFFSEFLFLSSCFFELLEEEPGILLGDSGGGAQKMKSILTLVTWFLIFLYKLKQKWQIGVTTITGRGSPCGDFCHSVSG